MKIERFFVAMGRLFIERPKISLVLVCLFFGCILSQLPQLRIDTSAESFLHPDAPAILEYNEFRQEFGRDEFFVVVITGQDVFELDYLQNLKDLHEQLELSVQRLQSVESLVNVRNIYGDGDDLIAED
ncbi:MAG: hypothetical protein HRU20_30600, partial [Pseudomonadales bacterium]|nr:hypothetical protein [Pseudomonadales bacterium]